MAQALFERDFINIDRLPL